MAPPVVRFALVCACALLAACGGGGGGGGGGGPPPPPPTYTVGGTLSGLSGTGLVLRNNAGNDLAVAAASTGFAFSTPLTSGSAYSVTVATQPTGPSQTCAVTAGSGAIATANVSTVQVACTTNSFTVGATVTGLDSDGLVLQNNGAVDLAVASDGTVTFAGQTLSGAAYSITVKTQPTLPPAPLPAQFCTVTNGIGTVGDGPVNVAVACLAPVYRYLYATNMGSNDLSAYSVNASTGALTAVPGAPFAADVRPFFGTPEPSGRFFYMANGGDSVNPPRVSAYNLDIATGVLTELPASPFELSVTPQPPGTSFASIPVPLAHRSGAFAYATTSLRSTLASSLFGATINPLTGELTEISGFPVDMGFLIGGTAQDSGGRILFVTTHPTGSLANGEIRTFVINSPSGTLTPVGVFPTVNPNLSFPIVTPGDNFVIAFSRSTEVLEVFAIGKSGGVPNGVLTVVGAPVPAGPAGSRPVSIAFSRRDNVLYVTNGAVGGALPPSLPPPSLAVFRLNPSTGVLTEIGTPISTNRADHGAVLHRSGRFLLQYNFSIAGFQTFAIDPTTFAPTLQPNVSTLSEPVSLFLPDFSGKYLYISHSASNSVSSYRIDAATGALTLVNTVPAGSQPLYLSPAGFQPQ